MLHGSKTPLVHSETSGKIDDGATDIQAGMSDPALAR